MNGNLQVFNYGAQSMHILLDENNEPWWFVKDVCTVLDISNYRDAVSLLDPDEKGVGITDTPGGPQEMITVNEPGLYSLIFRSRKPEARAFKRWITHEVIPAIRKTGVYAVGKGGGTDALLQMAELMVEGLRKTKEIEGRLEVVEAAVAGLPDLDYKTVVGYANEIFRPVSLKEARRLGVECTRESHKRGYKISSAPHPTYGSVHAYHVDVLKAVFGDMRK